MSQEGFTLKSGVTLEEGDGLFVLTRAAGTSEEFFTRGKEFVPERWDDRSTLAAGCEEGSTAAAVARLIVVFRSWPRSKAARQAKRTRPNPNLLCEISSHGIHQLPERFLFLCFNGGPSTYYAV